MASTKVRNVGTWDMTPQELARVWAEHFGYVGRRGGWIYRPDGTPVAQGWDAFAARLVALRYIKPGVGVDWRASGPSPRLARMTAR